MFEIRVRFQVRVSFAGGQSAASAIPNTVSDFFIIWLQYNEELFILLFLNADAER